MAQFDEVFADLQAKISAVLAVIAQYPEVAAEVRAAIDTAQAAAAAAEERMADDARANSLQLMINQARDALAQAATPE